MKTVPPYQSNASMDAIAGLAAGVAGAETDFVEAYFYPALQAVREAGKDVAYTFSADAEESLAQEILQRMADRAKSEPEDVRQNFSTILEDTAISRCTVRKSRLLKSSITESFNTAAAKEVFDYPEALSHFVVSTEEQIVFISPQIEQEGATPEKVDDIRQIFVKHWNENGHVSASYVTFSNDIFSDGRAIGINIATSLDAKDRDSVMWWSFYHELGHFVVPGGIDAQEIERRECIAETYSALRHVQKFGNDTDYIRTLSAYRANNLVTGQKNAIFYYHPDAMEMVDKLKTEQDLTALSPAETVALTIKIVDTCLYDRATREKVIEAAAKIDVNAVTRESIETLKNNANDPVTEKFYKNFMLRKFGDIKPGQTKSIAPGAKM